MKSAEYIYTSAGYGEMGPDPVTKFLEKSDQDSKKIIRIYNTDGYRTLIACSVRIWHRAYRYLLDPDTFDWSSTIRLGMIFRIMPYFSYFPG
jgi:hypothetical protein